jgi:hypothetical protein
MRDDEFRIPPPGYRSAPQRRAEEMRRMVYLGGGAAVIVLLGVIAYFVATGSGSDSVPVIQAQTTPVKVKPADPGGLAVTTQGSGLLTNGSSSAVAPAPETPDPAALAAAAQQEQQASGPQPAKPAATTPTPTPTPAPATPAPAQAAATQAPAVSIPSVPETPAAPGSKQTATNVSPPSKEAAKTHDLAQEYRPPAADHHGPVRVQLAALDSRDAAMKEWDHLSHRMPALFDGRRPIFAQAQVNGHTWWRVRTAGFSSIAEASKFCEDVRAHGSACNVASY